MNLLRRLRCRTKTLGLVGASLDLGLKSLQVIAYDSGRHFSQRDATRFAVFEESMNGMAIRPFRMRVFLTGEKLLIGEMGVASGQANDGGRFVLARVMQGHPSVMDGDGRHASNLPQTSVRDGVMNQDPCPLIRAG